MKINLSKKELNKCISLLDTKEINMSFADLLFQAYEEKDFFAVAKTKEEFYQKLLMFWGIDEDNNDDIALSDKWIKDSITPLNNDFFTQNPYYSLIKPNEIKNTLPEQSGVNAYGDLLQGLFQGQFVAAQRRPPAGMQLCLPQYLRQHPAWCVGTLCQTDRHFFRISGAVHDGTDAAIFRSTGDI